MKKKYGLLCFFSAMSLYGATIYADDLSLVHIWYDTKNLNNDAYDLMWAIGDNDTYFSYVYAVIPKGSEDEVEVASYCGYMLYDLRNLELAYSQSSRCILFPPDDAAAINMGITIRPYVDTIAPIINQHQQQYGLTQADYFDPYMAEDFVAKRGDFSASIADFTAFPLCSANMWVNFTYVGLLLTLEEAHPPENEFVQQYCAFLNDEILSYTVTPKDTLYAIAKKFNIPTDRLKEANKLDSNLIQIGQELIIPH